MKITVTQVTEIEVTHEHLSTLLAGLSQDQGLNKSIDWTDYDNLIECRNTETTVSRYISTIADLEKSGKL